MAGHWRDNDRIVGNVSANGNLGYLLSKSVSLLIEFEVDSIMRMDDGEDGRNKNIRFHTQSYYR